MAEVDVSAFNELISNFVGKMKTKHRGDSGVNNSDHVYISSNVPCEKSRSHHGCEDGEAILVSNDYLYIIN